MKIKNHNWICSSIMFLALTNANPTLAQTVETTTSDQTVQAETEAEAAKSAAAADVRDAVHENLDTLHEDLDVAIKQETEQVEKAAQGDIPEQPTERAEPKSFWDHLTSVPGYLQSVPDRLPWIRERGLIFFGRAELDGAYYSSGITKSDSGFRVRSLRAGLAKAYKYNISAKVEIDLTDGDSNFADLYARYNHKRFGLFTIGNQRVAQTLVNQTSRISRTFMEEPLPAEAFGLGRRLALGWDSHLKKGGVHVTLFGPDLNGSIGDSGYASRVYFNPTRSRFSVFHVGGSVVSEKMSRKTRFFSHPESRVTSERFVDTGLFENVSHQNIYGLEFAGAKESFMFRTEFFRATWNQTDTKDPVFKGFYAQASWILSGELFKYTQGKFLRVRPQNEGGAWEAAVRYSRVNLNDQAITGGEERNLSLAVNWYAPGNQFRVMSNIIFVRTDENAGDENPTIFQMRAQLHW
jgi:phosphate-selective porin OprO/OprP